MMTYSAFTVCHNYTEDDSMSADNHILHYGREHFTDWDDHLEIDEDLETMQISVRLLRRTMHIKEA